MKQKNNSKTKKICQLNKRVEELEKSCDSLTNQTEKHQENEEVKQLNKRCEELQKSTEFVCAKLDDRESQINNNKEAIKIVSNKQIDLENKVSDLEDRGRRSNLVFFGIPEEQNEDCIAKIATPPLSR